MRGAPQSAYPIVRANFVDSHVDDHGMTLRDRFASDALATAYAQVSAVDGRFSGGWGAVTQIAYVIADHMLEERAR